jgi:nucleoside-diphosphate-sugar epimerase
VKVLVTGALGNVGRNVVDALLADGHSVRAMRHGAAPDDRGLTRRWGKRVEICDADVRVLASVAGPVRDVDVVVHLAFVIPPACLEHPEAARAVNVDGTRNVLEAMKLHAPKAKLLFASSLDVFGRTAHLAPPRRVSDPVQATDVYSEHKIECEKLVRDSGLAWTILRYADVPPIALRKPVPIMFEIPLAQRIECIHPRDAGLATARAAVSDEAWGKVWLIGGGRSCQVTYGEYLTRLFSALELGPPLPPSAFTREPYCTDWLDSEDSERAFHYQRSSFDTIVAEVAALLGWRRPLLRLVRPVVRWRMLSMSRHYRRAMADLHA